jgi:hypothetical protein
MNPQSSQTSRSIVSSIGTRLFIGPLVRFSYALEDIPLLCRVAGYIARDIHEKVYNAGFCLNVKASVQTKISKLVPRSEELTWSCL